VIPKKQCNQGDTWHWILLSSFQIATDMAVTENFSLRHRV